MMMSVRGACLAPNRVPSPGLVEYHDDSDISRIAASAQYDSILKWTYMILILSRRNAKLW